MFPWGPIAIPDQISLDGAGAPAQMSWHRFLNKRGSEQPPAMQLISAHQILSSKGQAILGHLQQEAILAG